MRPSIHRPGVLEDARAAAGLDPEDVRRLRNALYKRGVPAGEAVARLPAPARTRLPGAVALEHLELVDRHDSRRDGATKLVLRTRAGLTLESVVLRLRSGRSSVCVSSQIGCAAACRFCATGQMSRVRNLSVEEILEQTALAGQVLQAEGRRLRNVVFMGMGEPMHNRAVVEAAVARLIDPRWFALSPRHVVVSTIGIVDEMRHFVARFPEVQLAVSLHAVRPEVRRRLMPLAARTSLDELWQALAAVQAVRRGPTMLEYLLLDEINDTDEDLDALRAYCRGLDVHINLIPFNPIAASPWLHPSTPARQARFTGGLKEAGLTVTTRFSLGLDIAAACGQLALRAAADSPSHAAAAVAVSAPRPPDAAGTT
jgi:23S rRNA (adenine2503-C2)-methyltransferase